VLTSKVPHSVAPDRSALIKTLRNIGAARSMLHWSTIRTPGAPEHRDGAPEHSIVVTGSTALSISSLSSTIFNLQINTSFVTIRHRFVYENLARIFTLGHRHTRSASSL
jgi:hypothetical protein